MASMRRTPEETELSLVSFSRPISPVAAVCVPPQSSVEKPSESLTTRTLSPYFSPNSAMAWYSFTATSMGTSSSVSTLGVGQHFAVDDGLDLFEFLIGHLREVGKIEAQPRRDRPSEPACFTCVPRTWRSAACSRCVPV